MFVEEINFHEVETRNCEYYISLKPHTTFITLIHQE